MCFLNLCLMVCDSAQWYWLMLCWLSTRSPRSSLWMIRQNSLFGTWEQEGRQGQKTDPSSPNLPCVMLTDHWVATHIIASVSDQPYGRHYSVFSCKSSCISCTLVGPCAHWTWAPILETSSWLSTRSPHTSLVFWVIRQPAGKIPWADIMMSEKLYLFSTSNIYCSIYKCADSF